MQNTYEVQESAFKFRCEPVERQEFIKTFEQQSVLAADLCNDLFWKTYQALKDGTKKWRLAFTDAVKQLRQQYAGKLPAAVFEGCCTHVQAQFANAKKRQKLLQRLEIPRFSAKSIPIRSDQGMRFAVLPNRPNEILAVRVVLALLPNRARSSVVHIRLKDQSAASILQRILNGYEVRRWLKQEQTRLRRTGEIPPCISKEILCSEESYPPSSAGAVIYDREKREFYISIGYSRPQQRLRVLDPNRIMAIDVGISSPLTLAYNFNKQPIRTDELGTMLKEARSEFYKRRRIIQAKFAAAPNKVLRQRLRKLSDAWNGRIRQLMGNTCAYIRKSVEQYQIGRVILDRPRSYEPTFFTIQCRGEKFRVPVLHMIDMLERDLRELLGDENVDSRSFSYSSQICSQCGSWNREFTWSYRKEHGWPDFSCPNCGTTLDADINAAQVILREDYHQIVERIRAERQLIEEDLGVAVREDRVYNATCD